MKVTTIVKLIEDRIHARQVILAEVDKGNKSYGDPDLVADNMHSIIIELRELLSDIRNITKPRGEQIY